MAEHDSSKLKRKIAADETRLGWRMAGTGFEVASQVAAGALLGWLFDRWRGHGHTGVMVGSIIGIVVGLWSLIRSGLKLNRQLDAQRAKIGYPPPLSSKSAKPDHPDAAEQAENDDWDKDDDDWNDDAQPDNAKRKP